MSNTESHNPIRIIIDASPETLYNYLDVIQNRAENIVKELNPEHPSDTGPANPA